MTSFATRVIGAIRLDAATYEEVEADRHATGQALAVVLVASLAAGLGSAGLGAAGLVLNTVAELVAWVAWAVLVYLIGTRVLPEPQTRTDVGELLRTLGFAAAPGIFRVLAAVPGLRRVVFVVVTIWMLAAMVLAVRQALDYRSTGRAIAVCVLAWLLAFMIAVLIGLVLARPVS